MRLKRLSLLSLLCATLLSSTILSTSEHCSIPQEASIPDCNCRFESVNHAVEHFISPILTNITRTTFFRYFLVDFESPCPFWQEEKQCGSEACAVCTCNETEIPSAWKNKGSGEEADFGWVSSEGSIYDQQLGKVVIPTLEQLDTNTEVVYDSADEVVDHRYSRLHDQQKESGAYLQFLHNTETCQRADLWTVLSHDDSDTNSPISKVGVYVNLLTNPERYTGYAGPSAARVWRAIQEENCFEGTGEDNCLEKRVFGRVMKGLRASISVHIARNYRHGSGEWGRNLPLYWQAVGNHPDRVENVYFAFLFLLRATVKVKDVLANYPYHTGNVTDDAHVRQLIGELVSNLQGRHGRDMRLHVPENLQLSASPAFAESLNECSYGFDETAMFQVEDSLSGPLYWRTLEQKHLLREEFRLKFRNISRIMDCVICEKCRLWGKLQILGFGTAIKVLLTTEDEIASAVQRDNGVSLLNRQEIIALVNVLNQFSKSVEFAAYAHQVNSSAPITTQLQLPVNPGDSLSLGLEGGDGELAV